MSNILERDSTDSELRVLFCDQTTDIRTYEDTAWGNIEARDMFHKFCDQGSENNTIFERDKPCHIVQVTLYHAKRHEQRDFECIHTQRKKEQSA